MNKADRYIRQFRDAEAIAKEEKMAIHNANPSIKKATKEAAYHTNQPNNVRIQPKESTLATNHSIECFVCKEHPYSIKQYEGILVTFQCCTKHTYQDCLNVLNTMFSSKL
jgi:1,2-phenylacetyl-CoA epoxidase catalytic subunit